HGPPSGRREGPVRREGHVDGVAVPREVTARRGLGGERLGGVGEPPGGEGHRPDAGRVPVGGGGRDVLPGGAGERLRDAHHAREARHAGDARRPHRAPPPRGRASGAGIFTSISTKTNGWAFAFTTSCSAPAGR